MKNRISVITIGVSDLARSREFYVNGLGWTPAFEAEEVVFFQLNGVLAGLFGLDDMSQDSGRPRADLAAGAMGLGYNCAERDEVDAILEQAENAGATRPGPAIDRVWGGYSGYFIDPDGHTWEIAWNPNFTIDDDGNITLPPGPEPGD